MHDYYFLLKLNSLTQQTEYRDFSQNKNNWQRCSAPGVWTRLQSKLSANETIWVSKYSNAVVANLIDKVIAVNLSN